MIYTIVGVYKDNDQSYRTYAEAPDPKSAAFLAQAECLELNGHDPEDYDSNDDYYPTMGHATRGPLRILSIFKGEHKDLVDQACDPDLNVNY